MYSANFSRVACAAWAASRTNLSIQLPCCFLQSGSKPESLIQRAQIQMVTKAWLELQGQDQRGFAGLCLDVSIAVRLMESSRSCRRQHNAI